MFENLFDKHRKEAEKDKPAPRKQYKLVAAGVLVMTRDDNDDKQHKFNITLHNEDDRLCS